MFETTLVVLIGSALLKKQNQLAFLMAQNTEQKGWQVKGRNGPGDCVRAVGPLVGSVASAVALWRV